MQQMYQELVTARAALARAEGRIPGLLARAPVSDCRQEMMLSGLVFCAADYVAKAIETIGEPEGVGQTLEERDALADSEASPVAVRLMDCEDPEWLEAVSVRCAQEDRMAPLCPECTGRTRGES